MEDACGVVVDEGIAALRRLLYCGEWIQSHALHVYLLHAPDFLDCADAVQLAERDPGTVARGLDMKRTGNLVMQTVGGRAVHPVNVRVGGFYRAPDVASIRALAEPLRRARDEALETVGLRVPRRVKRLPLCRPRPAGTVRDRWRTPAHVRRPRAEYGAVR
jgi:coenzyme F420-reducing hydrogenase alpha subunit